MADLLPPAPVTPAPTTPTPLATALAALKAALRAYPTAGRRSRVDDQEYWLIQIALEACRAVDAPASRATAIQQISLFTAEARTLIRAATEGGGPNG